MSTIVIHNAETGEITERAMTAAELKKWQADLDAEEAKVKERNEAKIAKEALLAKLGITQEEAQLLLS